MSQSLVPYSVGPCMPYEDFRHRYDTAYEQFTAAQQKEFDCKDRVKKLQSDILLCLTDPRYNEAKDLLAARTRDLQVAESAWRNASLYTAELRNVLMELAQQRDGNYDVDEVKFCGVHSLEHAKPIRRTAEEVTPPRKRGLNYVDYYESAQRLTTADITQSNPRLLLLQGALPSSSSAAPMKGDGTVMVPPPQGEGKLVTPPQQQTIEAQQPPLHHPSPPRTLLREAYPNESPAFGFNAASPHAVATDDALWAIWSQLDKEGRGFVAAKTVAELFMWPLESLDEELHLPKYKEGHIVPSPLKKKSSKGPIVRGEEVGVPTQGLEFISTVLKKELGFRFALSLRPKEAENAQRSNTSPPVPPDYPIKFDHFALLMTRWNRQ